MLKVRHISFFSLFIIMHGPIFSQVQFAPYSSIVTGSWASVVAIGDINNDGLNDVAVGNESYFDANNDYRILVYRQNSSGGLNAPSKHIYNTTLSGWEITSIKIVDINHDSLSDIVFGYGTKIGVFYQNASGELDPLTEIETNQLVESIEVEDINNDNLLDVAISTGYQTTFKVYFQTSSGSFNETAYTKPAVQFKEVEIADLNNDGLKDLVYVVTLSSIYIYYQNTVGGFDNFIQYTAPMIDSSSAHLFGIDVGDLNNDGLTDVAVAHYANSPRSRLFIWHQNANGLLDNPIGINAYDCLQPLEIADLNQDGKNEIIAVHGGGLKVSCFERDASNLYTATLFTIPYATHYMMHGLAIGDVDNDGKKDIAIADYNNGLVILRNTSTLGTNSFENSSSIIYPNPVENSVTIDLPNFNKAEVALYDFNGKKLYSQIQTTTQMSIDLSRFASGIYLVEIISENQTFHKKIIKK